MDSTFATDSDGNATNIGKLVFGKNQSRDAQEWYILGQDTGVTGDNTIIFAASPIVTKQAFQDDYENIVQRITAEPMTDRHTASV